MGALGDPIVSCSVSLQILSTIMIAFFDPLLRSCLSDIDDLDLAHPRRYRSQYDRHSSDSHNEAQNQPP